MKLGQRGGGFCWLGLNLRKRVGRSRRGCGVDTRCLFHKHFLAAVGSKMGRHLGWEILKSRSPWISRKKKVLWTGRHEVTELRVSWGRHLGARGKAEKK